jgi:ABC-type transport system substrate-binding protein
MDPAIRSPIMSLIAGRIEGLDDLAERASRNGRRFDYDAAIPGLVALDRYTVRIRLTQPDPVFVYLLANPDLSIVPREAVEAEGADFARHPTGSGPYVVREFKPGTRLVLERNPVYRDVYWEDVARGAATDPVWVTALRGRRFPLPDRVELLVIPEPTTGVLALERGEIDILATPIAAIENNRLRPRLAAEGLRLVRGASPRLVWFAFNMRDPQVGGTEPANVALRRAIAMAIDDDEYVRVFENGTGNPPKYFIPPGIPGHDPADRHQVRFEPATANTLLDRFGYRKGSDGYRRRPDGALLSVTFIVGTSSRSRQWAEFLKRSVDRIGVRINFDTVAPADQLSRLATCHYQMMDGGWIFDWPDGSNLMLSFYGRTSGTGAAACMQDREFDALYERLIVTPLAERASLYHRMLERLNALAPVRLVPVPDDMYLTASYVRGLVVHPAFGDNFAIFPYVDVTATR